MQLRPLVTAWRLAAVLAVLTVTLGGVVVVAPPASAGPQLNGGGSSFAALELDQWRADTARKPYGLSLNYNATGSTDGRTNFSGGLYDFAASDIVYQPNDGAVVSQSPSRCGVPLPQCFKYVTVTAGGLAFMYNLIDQSGQRITNLQLTREEVCKIFTGAITTWNDPELVRTNMSTIPDMSELDRPIGVKVRSDGAGESYVLSQFCIAVAPGVWTDFVNAEKSLPGGVGDDDPTFLTGNTPVSNWPTSGPGNSLLAGIEFADNLANTITDPVAGANSIGYVANGYAVVRRFPVASVQNVAGAYVQPTALNVNVALAYAADSPARDGTFVLNFNGPDARAYFPSTYSYVLAQTLPTSKWTTAEGAVLGTFLCYAVGQGQTEAQRLGYAPLSAQVVAISVNAITQIPGAPDASKCTAGAPPPPPPVAVAGGKGAGASQSSAGNASHSVAGGAAAGTASGIGAGAASSQTIPGQQQAFTGPGQCVATTPTSTPTTIGGAATSTTAPAHQTTTTTSKHASGATTTTAHAGASTSMTVAATTSTTQCTSPVQFGQFATPTTFQSAPISSGGPGGGQVLTALLEGAVLCGLGVALVGAHNRGRPA